MPLTLLQMDFPTDGPWGAARTGALRARAEDIARTPGLRWKVWTESEAEGLAGGIYLFEDEASARAYLAMHTERLARTGVRDIRARVFAVNEDLTRIDRGPID